MSVLLKVTAERYKASDQSFKSAALYERAKSCLEKYKPKMWFNSTLDLPGAGNNAIIKSPGIQLDTV